MAATYRTSVAGGDTTGTGDRTATITPAVGDLLVVFCSVSVNTNNTPTCSDDNGGSYDRIAALTFGPSINSRMSAFIRTALMPNTTSTVVTVATGANDSGEVVVVAASGMSRTGLEAKRQSGTQSEQAASTTPAPALPASALTANMTLGAVGNERSPATITPPTNWTERQDVGQATPSIGLEVVTRDSGFTGTTVTWGGTSATAFASIILELDGTVAVDTQATDTGTGTDSSSRTVTLYKDGTDTGAGVDTSALTIAANKDGTDTGSGTDSAVKTSIVVKIGTDSATGTDTPLKSRSLAGTDSATGADLGATTSTYDYTTPTEADATMSATIRQTSPTTADPRSEVIRLDGTGAAEVRALVRLPRTAPIGVGATVLHAEIHLFKAATWPGAATVTAEPVDAEWDAESVTWATAPAVRAESATVSVATAGAAGDEVTMDVTSLVRASVAADDASGARWYGVRLKSSYAGEGKFYSAYDTPAYRPFLKIEWSVPPDAPTNLLPSGGRAVSDTTPTLTAQFHDADAEDTCSAIQVEVSTSDTFATPSYISVKAATTAALFDLGAAPTGANVTLATSLAADDIIDTSATHGLVANDRVVFSSLTGGTGLTAGTVYYVISANLAATTFQVSATEDGTAIDFSTNITAGSTAPVALTPGVTNYWRMRVWDNHDIPSDFSEAAEFVVTAKGSNSVASLGGTVATPTPLTSWTFTPAGTETQSEIEIEYEVKIDGVWRQHFLYPRTVTAVTSSQLANADRLEEGYTYRRTVRLWDSVDREDTAGDRAFLEDSQEFTLTTMTAT